MIYLATPFSDSDPNVQEQRFQQACQAAAALIRNGTPVFCPIAHSYPIAQYDLPTDWTFWERVDRLQMQSCTEVVVVKLDGWEQSRGIAAEVQIAEEMGLPVRYVEPHELL